MRRINLARRQIIKSCESLRLRAYLCPRGKWTIGWGDTGPDVRPGLTITEEEAEARFDRRLATEFEPGVERLLDVEVTGNQFSALVSFAYNCGLGEDGLGGSTLLRKLNAGDLDGAAREFPRWNRSGGSSDPALRVQKTKACAPSGVKSTRRSRRALNGSRTRANPARRRFKSHSGYRAGMSVRRLALTIMRTIEPAPGGGVKPRGVKTGSSPAGAPKGRAVTSRYNALYRPSSNRYTA